MTVRIARRAATVAVSAAVAVTGFLATGNTASAAPLPGSEQSVVTGAAHGHSGGPRPATERLGEVPATGRGGADARRTWVLDQLQWIGDHSGPTHTAPASIDDARRTWVLDQLQWIGDTAPASPHLP